MQGVKEKNKQMLKEALDYLSVLALYTPQDQMQLLVDERAAVFHTYICFLSPAEAVEMIDQVLEDDWIKDSNVRSLLVVHRESSRFAKQLYDKSKKDLENVVKQYGSKNFEILTIFTGVIAFITYGLQIPGKATSLYDLLMLMFALLLSLVGLFSFIFSILRSGWYLILLFLVIGVFIGFIYMNPQGLKAEYVKQVASVTAKA